MKKRWISLLLVFTMLLSLMVVPANAAVVDGTATLTITPNKTEAIGGSDSVEIIYTIKLTPPAEKPVGPFQFELVAPEGMTLSETKLNSYDDSNKGGDGYWVNANELEYYERTNTGIYRAIGYTANTHILAAYGLDDRSLTSEVDVMTIKATVAAGYTGSFTLNASDVTVGVDGTNQYSVSVSTTPVTIVKAPMAAASATVDAPTKGNAFPTSVTIPENAAYSASVAWFTDADCTTSAGNIALGGQTYYAQITLTPDKDNGESFASSVAVTGSATGDYTPTSGNLVLTVPFTTPQRMITDIAVYQAQISYEVGDELNTESMKVRAIYDDGTTDEDYKAYTVSVDSPLTADSTTATITSTDNTEISKNLTFTVRKKTLSPQTITVTPKELTYNGEDQKGNVTVVIKDIATELTGTLNVIYKISDQVVNEIKDAGTYDVYVSTEGGTMYNPLEQTKVGTVTINKANASVTAPATKTDLTYNGKAQALIDAGSTTGGTMQYKLGADGTYSTDIPTATDAGTYTVYYKVVGNDNYNGVDESSVTVTIAKTSIDPTVSIEGWTYGESAKTPGVTGNSGNGTVTYSYAARGSDDFKTATPTDAGEYTVKATIAETANYLGGEATADFTIAKANAFVTAPATKTDLTYNGKAQALIDAGSTTGGTMQYKLGADGTYSTAIPTATDAGTYTVYYKVVGNDNYYGVGESSVTVTIKKQPVDVSQLAWQTTDSFNYDAQAKTVTLSSAIPQGLTANYENNTATYVGNYTAHVSFTADDNHEVSGTLADFSWKINPVANPITVTKDSYNLAKGGNTLDLTTLIQDAKGTVTFSVKSGDAATLQGSVLTSGADSSDTPVVINIHIGAVDENNDGTAEYNAYDKDSAIAVTVVDKEQKELTVTMGGWTYGDNAKSPAFTAPAGSAAPTITYTGKNYPSNEVPTDAGTYTVQVVCETATEIHTGSAAFTIAPRTAAITWSNTSYTYDGQSHVPTATVSNKVGQDSVSVTVSGAASDAGSHIATATGLDNANYVLPATAPTRSFTIDKRVAELEWNNTTFTYDGQSHVPTATVKNAVTGDTVTVTVTGEKTAAGSYTATATGLSNSNYALPNARTQSFTINKRVAELNWSNTSFTYDGKSHVPTATVTNAVEGDTVTVTVTGGQTNAGSYTATATRVSNSNYALPDGADHGFTIAPKNISDMTVNLSAAALTYNGKAQTKAVASVRDGSTTLSSGRDYTVSGATQTNAGHYELTVTGTGNYIGSKTVAWEIAPKAVTVTANNANKVYGAEDPALTAKVSGTVGGDTVDYTVSRAEGNNVGTYAITPAGDENQGNYTVTFKNGTFTITKANASVTSSPQAVTDLVFNGTDQKLITAGQAEGGELQYKLGNGAYGTDIPEATEAGNYTVYYKVVGDANHNNVSEARITVTIAPLSGDTWVTSGDVTASTQPDDTINQLSGVEQFTDEAVGIQEGDSDAVKQEKRETAVKNALVSAAGTSATNASALYYVNAGSSAAKVTFALPALAATHNFKVMYMNTSGIISQVTNAKVTASGIEVPVAAEGDGVYLVTYTNKPIPVIIHDDTVKSAGTGDMGLVLYTVLAVSGATGAAWLGLKKRKED